MDAAAVSALEAEGVTITREDGHIVIDIDESNDLRESKGKVDKDGNHKPGKSFLLASSHGLTTLGHDSEGRGIWMNLNIGIYKVARAPSARQAEFAAMQAELARMRAALAEAQAHASTAPAPATGKPASKQPVTEDGQKILRAQTRARGRGKRRLPV